jgi:hypothetical protein
MKNIEKEHERYVARQMEADLLNAVRFGSYLTTIWEKLGKDDELHFRDVLEAQELISCLRREILLLASESGCDDVALIQELMEAVFFDLAESQRGLVEVIGKNRLNKTGLSVEKLMKKANDDPTEKD